MRDLKNLDDISKNFRELFPEDVYELINQIIQHGYGLTLVGGAVRDYLRGEGLSKDLDFEIRHKFEHSEKVWTEMISKLAESLKSKHYDIEKLPFHILKISLGDYDIELSSARIEAYHGEGPFGHSDFEARLYSKIDYSKSFERRDFTINAIGIEFGGEGAEREFKLIDPFGGISDLESKKLRPCGESFYDDPVRFLRLIRFKDKFNFEFVGELERFNLSKLTSHYFFQESSKNFFPVAKLFFKETAGLDCFMPPDLSRLSFLKNKKIENLGFLSKLDILLILSFMQGAPSKSERQDFSDYAKIKSNMVDDYNNLKLNLSKLSKTSDEGLKRLLRHNNFFELLENEDLKRIALLHKLFNRHRLGRLDLLEKVEPELYKVFSFFSKVFGSETQGKTVAGRLVRLVAENKKRGAISIYAHLLEYYKMSPVLPESRFGN